MVKAALLSNLYMGIESSTGLNTFLSLAYMKGERGDIVKKREQEIKSVTVDDIKRLALSTFENEPLLAQMTLAK